MALLDNDGNVFSSGRGERGMLLSWTLLRLWVRYE